MDQRLEAHSSVSAALACLSDEQLLASIAEAPPLHSGIGGTSAMLAVNGTTVFVKKVPLTDLERQPENRMSTANLFELPLYYQYGIGSSGFGAWRELAANLTTTAWVLSGECPSFPVMFHWRVLPAAEPSPMSPERRQELDAAVRFWEESPAIRKRLEGIHGASAHVVMFLEYFPQTLHTWLRAELGSGEEGAERALAFVEEHLRRANLFMKDRGFVHFDAHFANILTDGEALYFGDLGLALSSTFDLGSEEISFLERHRTYDQAGAATSLVHSIVTARSGDDAWRRLAECLNEMRDRAAPGMRDALRKHGPVALVMAEFFERLRNGTKRTPYPADQLDALLR